MKQETKDLVERVKGCVRATSTTMHDNDQRSAIGMVDRWVGTERLELWNPDKWNSAHQSKETHGQIHCPARDALAAALVEILTGADEKDQRVALKAVREMINEPYVDEAMLGFQASRQAHGAVGSEKKNTKAGV